MTKLTSYDLSQTHGMLSIGEIDLIKTHVAKLLKKPLIINIGAGFGTSSLAMLEVHPEAFIWSIDKRSREQEIVNVNRAGFENRIVRLLAKSQNINWPKQIKVNCIFVDGGHNEHHIKRDIEIYKPVVKKNGLMFFHDYRHPNYGPDHLISNVIDDMMSDWQQVGLARYLVVFKNG